MEETGECRKWIGRLSSVTGVIFVILRYPRTRGLGGQSSSRRDFRPRQQEICSRLYPSSLELPHLPLMRKDLPARL